MQTMNRRRAVVAGLISLAMLAACGSSSDDSSSANAGAPGSSGQAARTVEVKMKATGYEPSTLTAAKDETVTFNVTNEDTKIHEFVLGNANTQDEYAKVMSDMSTGQPMEMPDTDYILNVEPGKTEKVTWTFPSAETKVIYGSHQPGDYEKFKGTITVK